MSPQVEAALIAAGVGVLTVAVTSVAQILSRLGTKKDLEKQREQLDRSLAQQRDQVDRSLAQQRDQVDRTLAQQRDQVDRTLAQQRDQVDRTLAEQRDRTLNERFATAADKLGDDKPQVRLAGAYAMAGLADDWCENRQSCVAVLCAYLRLPYDPDPGEKANSAQRNDYLANREVRHTIIRLIKAHLRPDMTTGSTSWRKLTLDFTEVVFDGGEFILATFSHATAWFTRAKFCGGKVYFTDAEFSGGMVDFSGAEFSGGTVDFSRAKFSGGTVDFSRAEFSGSKVYFGGAAFSGGKVDFSGAKFSSGTVDFLSAMDNDGSIGPKHPVDWSHEPMFDPGGPPPAVVTLPSGRNARPT